MSEHACIRCGHVPEQGDEYCILCGAPLRNRCTNDGGPFGDPCSHLNAPHASFCAKCGHRTVFHKAGLIASPYAETVGHRTADPDEWQHFSHRFFWD